MIINAQHLRNDVVDGRRSRTTSASIDTAALRADHPPRRGGAVIVIVLSLMAALAFLGFFFYEFSTFERSASERFATFEVDADVEGHFDIAAEQLIVGTRTGYEDSVLWGNKDSLLATLIGRIDPNGLIPEDLNPHNGTGIRVRFTDADNDGIPDDTQPGATPNGVPDLIVFSYQNEGGTDTFRTFADPVGTATNPPPRFNLSRVANAASAPAGSTGIGTGSAQVPDYIPDAGYTYPDINNKFLAYESTYYAPNGTRHEIYIPSFVRPQYFHDRRDGSVFDFTTLYTSNSANSFSGDTTGLVFSPHAQHRRFAIAATAGDPDVDAGQRYLSSSDTARSGDRNRILPAYIFNQDTNGDGVTNGMGIFDTGGFDAWDLLIDTDGDGVTDAMPLDLDLPIVEFADGRQGIPLVGVKILDADALLNLNANGNQYNLERISRILGKAPYPEYDPSIVAVTPPGGSTFQNPARNHTLDVWAADRNTRYFGTVAGNPAVATDLAGFISASSFGQSPYEINPAFGLSAWNNNFYQNEANLWSRQASGGTYVTSLSQFPHGHMFGDIFSREANTNPSQNQTELAQMEFFMLLNGHTGGDGFQRISGRHGEASLNAVGTPGASTKLQPIVTRDTTLLGINSIIPGAGQSYTNTFQDDDDRDHVGIETWLDNDLDGTTDTTDGDGVVQADELDLSNAIGTNDIFGNDTFDQQNAIASGGEYFPKAFGERVRVPANVHPTTSTVIADPFTDRVVTGTPPLPPRSLDLDTGRDGLADETAVRWPRYADNGRDWYTRNYPALMFALPAALDPIISVTNPSSTAGFLVDSTQAFVRVAGVAPYVAGAVGLTDETSFVNDMFDLVNEESEQIVGEEIPSADGDALFEPSEMAGLHLSESDYSLSGLVSRVRALAPMNFDVDPDAPVIRKRFTTESNDRLETAMMRPIQIGTTDVPTPRTWEFNRWEFDRAVAGVTVGPTGRINEMFPPVFGAAIPNDTTTAASLDVSIPPFSTRAFEAGDGLAGPPVPSDPFREVLRLALATSAIDENLAGDANVFARQNFGPFDGVQTLRIAARKKLRFDKILDRIDPINGEPVYRDLVPHPDFSRPPFDALTGALTLSPVLHTADARSITSVTLSSVEYGDPALASAANQEFWARQDRQDLARDIYVLAYTLCGPDGWNPTSVSPTGNALRENHVRMAAQFAVNVVDAIDRDSVVTEFSYDPDLSDGWDARPTGSSRVSVYGVEAATLSVSEVLLGRTQKLGSNDANTSWDDTNAQQFAAIELRNSSPFDVELYDNSWRVEVVVENGDLVAGTDQAIVDFAHAGGNFTRATSDFKRVRAGGNFLILDTTDVTTTPIASVAQVDTSAAGTPNVYILPKAEAGTPPASILLDAGYTPTSGNNREGDIGIDLASTDAVHQSYRTFERVFDEMSARMFSSTEHIVIPIDATSGDAPTGSITYSVRLWRKKNHMDPNDVLGVENNEWILVDEMVHESRDDGTNASGPSEVLDISNSGNAINDDTGLGTISGTSITTELQESWFSTERSEPFGRLVGPVINASGDGLQTSLQTNKGPGGTAQSVIQTADLQKHTFSAHLPSGTGLRDAHYGNSNLDPTETVRKNAAFETWHTHFDRDLLSPAELLSIPLFGGFAQTTGDINVGTAANTELTGTANLSDGSEDVLFRQLRNGADPGDRIVTRAAGSDALRSMPNTLAGAIESAGDANFGNRWYRIFDFVEVPSKINDTLELQDQVTGKPRFKSRTPGKINLNTMRHEQVLAAVLDEPTHLNPFDGLGVKAANANLAARSNDEIEGTARNWWNEFLSARDGVDPFESIPIPGVPGCRPFLPSTRTIDLAPAKGVDHSVARKGPRYLASGNRGAFPPTDRSASTTPADPSDIGLFEARTLADVGTDNVDPWTRNRLLAKVMNNTTQRSNVFLVWIALQYHHADHGWQTNGNPDKENVRIGGPMTDLPVYRTFMVVDRSLLEQAYYDPDPTDTTPGTFDFRKFILHRQRLR